MAKIKYSVDGRGVLKASADIRMGESTMKIGVTGAVTPGQTEKDADAWAQLTFDLYNLKGWLQDGTSKPEGGK